MSCANGIGLDVASTPHENLHLEDFRFTDLKWAKSSRMSKRWLVFFVRIKVRFRLDYCSDLQCICHGGICSSSKTLLSQHTRYPCAVAEYVHDSE